MSVESVLESIVGQPVILPSPPRNAAAPVAAPSSAAQPRGMALATRPWTLALLDAGLAVAGFALGYAVRYILHIGGIHDVVVPIDAATLAILGVIVVALTSLELARSGAYRRRLGNRGLDSYLAVVRAVSVAMAVMIIASVALQEQNVSRLTYVYVWLCTVGLITAGRFTYAGLLKREYRQGRGVRRTVVVGATPTGKMVMQNLATRLGRGYALLGFVEEHRATAPRFGRFPCLGTLADLDRVLDEHAVDEIVVALPAASHARMAAIFAHCQRAGIAVKLVPDLFDLRLSRVRMDEVAGIPLIDVRDERPNELNVTLKRLLDLSVAGLALVVAAPVMLVTALAIRLESPGPILFRQERLGKDGQPFTILKFRSMRPDAERQLALLAARNEASGPIFKMRRDPRVTRVGRVIRKLSIDELPQLWNVLRGEMSLVGPRPPLAHEVARYEAWHRRRLEGTPGITCLWGVSGRSKLDFDEMVMLDLYYIDNWSLGLDLRILVRTALTLLRPNGAY